MTDYNTLVNTPDELNTGNVLENKSLYWHPTVYSYDKASNTYTRDVMAQTSAYYIWENGTGTKAFPNGFQEAQSPLEPMALDVAKAEKLCEISLKLMNVILSMPHSARFSMKEKLLLTS